MDLYFWIPILITIAAVLLSPWYHPWIASLMGKEQSLAVVSRALEQYLSPDSRRAVVETGQNMDALDRSLAEFEKNHYNLWKLQRQKTIHKLAEFREKLDQVSTYVNASKTVGSTSSLLGSIGLILSQYIPTVSSYFQIAFSMRLIGDVLVPASDHYGSSITKDYIKDLKEVMKNDLDRTKHLRPSLVRARKLNEDFVQLFKCDFLSDQKDMEKELTDRVKVNDTLARGVELGLRESPGKVYNSKTLSTVREVGDGYKNILEKLRNPKVYKACKSAVEMVMDIPVLGYADMGQKLYFTGLRNILQHNDSNDNLAVLCLQEAPNILKQCISLNTSIRIAFEGKSNYHEPLKYLEEVLTNELEIVEKKISKS